MRWVPVISWLLAIAFHVLAFAWLAFDGARATASTAMAMNVLFVDLVPTPTAPTVTTTDLRVAPEAKGEREPQRTARRDSERSSPAPRSKIATLEPVSAQIPVPTPIIKVDAKPSDGMTTGEPTIAPDLDQALASPDNPPNAPTGDAMAQWQARLLAHLGTHHRYPFRARRLREEGVVQLRFAVDRNGRLIRSTIAVSSGHDLLDDEALAMIERAAPVPAPPPELAGDAIEVVVPVTFDLRRR